MAHLDDLALNAHLDGEADHRSHLESCASCRGRLLELTAVATRLAIPPQPLGAEAADTLIAAALGHAAEPGASSPAGGAGPGEVVSISSRPRRATRWLALAAVVLVGLAAVPVLLSNRDNSDTRFTSAQGGGGTSFESAAGDAADAAGSEEQNEAASGTASALVAGPVRDGDLGARGDVEDVARAARARLDTPSGGDETGPPVVARCEAQARSAAAETGGEPGELVYIATLTWRGQAAEALVFRLPDAPDAYALSIMERSGCAVLAQARI